MSRITEPEVLDLLTRLVDESLVVYEEDEQGWGRYRLLETVRQYGRGRLLESDEGETWRDRHRAHFLELSEDFHREVLGAWCPQWLARIAREHDNLRAALDWCASGDGADHGLRLAGALWRFWRLRGFFQEGRAYLESFLARANREPTTGRARALCGLAALASQQWETATAWQAAEESLAMFRQLEDWGGALSALNLQANSIWRAGDPREAARRYEEAIAICRDHGEREWMVVLLGNLGGCLFDLGDLEGARARLEECLSLCRAIGLPAATGVSLYYLGALAERRGEEEEARRLWQECREVDEARGLRGGSVLVALGRLAVGQGDYGTARRWLSTSLKERWELGQIGDVPEDLRGFAALAAAQGSHGQATRLFSAAGALLERTGVPLDPVEQQADESALAAARAALGEGAFAAALREGRLMTPEQAVAYALEGNPRQPS